MGRVKRVCRNKDLARLEKLALAQGWEVSATGSGHVKWTPPGGGPSIISSSTPRSPWSVTQTQRDLVKAGLSLDKPKKESKTVGTGTFKCRRECGDSFGTMNQRDAHEKNTCPMKPEEPVAPPPTPTRRRAGASGPKDVCPVRGCVKTLLKKNMPAHLRGHSERGEITTTIKYGRTTYMPSPGHAPAVERDTRSDTRDLMEKHGIPAGLGLPSEPPRFYPGFRVDSSPGTPLPLLPLIPEIPLLPMRPDPATVDGMIECLVATVFPEGPPVSNPDALLAMAAWVSATREFLEAVNY